MVIQSREQKLVDLCFSIGMTIYMRGEEFQTLEREEVGAWIADQLAGCGFPTNPCGASWGVLEKDTDQQKMLRIRAALEGAAFEIYEALKSE